MNNLDRKTQQVAEMLLLRDLLGIYPTGIVSVVSDTFNLWDVCTEYLPRLKEEILTRDGKLVIRPDSGDPVDILCGLNGNLKDISKHFPEGEILPEYFEDYLLDEVAADTPHGEHGVVEYEQTYIIHGELYKAKIHNISWNRHDKQYYYIDMYERAKITVEKVQETPEDKGVIELLWDVFGGTVNEQGYKVLDSHIGAIYGDSITVERAEEICRRLEAKGFASTNVVLGIGSFTYQYNTRDTFGFAVKATYIEKEVDVQVGTTPENLKWDTEIQGFEIFKDPVTDSGLKKSAKGLLKVLKTVDTNEYFLVDQCTWEDVEADDNELKIVFKDGEFLKETTMTEIRERVNKLV